MARKKLEILINNINFELYIKNQFFFFCLFVLTENRFICECRLRWIFDLHNQTKNKDLKHSLERITCTLEHTHQPINDNTLNDPRYQIHFETSSRNSQPMKFDLHNDLGMQSNHIDDEHRRQHHSGIAETVELLSINPNQLPCETVTDPTELPLQRESVAGYDLGKLFNSSSTTIVANFIATGALLFMALVISS